MNMLGNFKMASALQLAGANMAMTSNTAGNMLILDSFIPGFSILRELFFNYFKYDITSVVTRAIFVTIAVKAGQYIEEEVKEMLLRFFCSSVKIQPTDRLYREVMSWMSVHVIEKGARHMAAKSSKNDGSASDPYSKVAALYRQKPTYQYNAADFDDSTPPVTYAPAIGTQWFWYCRRLFMFALSGKNAAFYGREGCGEIVIYCVGRDPAPLRRFIQNCKDFEGKTRNSLTTLYIKAGGRAGSHWSDAILKPDRPIDAIDMDEELKSEILEDVQQYLHPTARRSYGRRGVPYRRGYLFYGPPGTGKTSMCFALAGHFNLELYTVSGHGLQDHELDGLFAALPPKCIVLLEDIDSAGITREHMDKKEDNDNGIAARNAARITLSGLLNAIDGTTSQEGRILIMTTNTPEKLDKALIRPGRIDKMIYFGPLTKRSAENMFMRMFSRDRNGDDEHAIWPVDKTLKESELRDMAVAFSENFFEGKITPAEVQGFLINNKSPQKCLDEVEAWIAKTLHSRDDAKAFEKMDTEVGEPLGDGAKVDARSTPPNGQAKVKSGVAPPRAARIAQLQERRKMVRGAKNYIRNTPPGGKAQEIPDDDSLRLLEEYGAKKDIGNPLLDGKAQVKTDDALLETAGSSRLQQLLEGSSAVPYHFLPTWGDYKKLASQQDHAKPHFAQSVADSEPSSTAAVTATTEEDTSAGAELGTETEKTSAKSLAKAQLD